MKYEKWLRRDGKDTAKICFLTLEDGAGNNDSDPKYKWITGCAENKTIPTWDEIWKQDNDSIGKIGTRICKICSEIITLSNADVNIRDIKSEIYKKNVQNIKFNPFPRKSVNHMESNKAICNYMGIEYTDNPYGNDWIQERTKCIIEKYGKLFSKDRIYIVCRHEWLPLMKYIYQYDFMNELRVYDSEHLSYRKFLSPTNNDFLFFYFPLLGRNITDSILKKFAKDLLMEMKKKRICITC